MRRRRCAIWSAHARSVRGDLMRARHRLGQDAVAPRHPLPGHNQPLGRAPPLVAGQARPRPARRAGDAPRLHRRDRRARAPPRDARGSDRRARCPLSPCAQTVARLRCLRGIDTLSAVGLAVEVGDFDRFERPGQLMSHLGLVPSEHSTGTTRRQGHITKTGSRPRPPAVG